jgi:hypoxanthine phosphoribosyltransferase
MYMIKILDKHFEIFISKVEIQSIVHSMAVQIQNDYTDKSPYFIVVLNGSLFFGADLIQQYHGNCKVSSIKCSSYKGMNSSEELNFELGFNQNIEDEHIIIIEDIVDTGFTVHKIKEVLKAFKPASVKFASLLYKPDSIKYPVNIDYIGKEIPSTFVLGYGLDYYGYGRNLKDIYSLSSSN